MLDDIINSVIDNNEEFFEKRLPQPIGAKFFNCVSFIPVCFMFLVIMSTLLPFTLLNMLLRKLEIKNND